MANRGVWEAIDSAGPACGMQSTEDDVDRYCPDRDLILKLYEEADRLMHR